MPINKYKCKHCANIIKRNSTKKWIKSICIDSGYKETRLILIKQNMTPTTPYTIRLDTEILENSIKNKNEKQKKELRKRLAKIINNYLKKKQ